MSERPELNKNLDAETFKEYYWLKEELIDFCRKYGLPVSGGKLDITERIAYYLETGNIMRAKSVSRKSVSVCDITEETKIESDFVCSEKHRAFFNSISATAFLLMLLFKNG